MSHWFIKILCIKESILQSNSSLRVLKYRIYITIRQARTPRRGVVAFVELYFNVVKPWSIKVASNSVRIVYIKIDLDYH